jgi:hypothetical protein
VPGEHAIRRHGAFAAWIGIFIGQFLGHVSGAGHSPPKAGFEIRVKNQTKNGTALAISDQLCD